MMLAIGFILGFLAGLVIGGMDSDDIRKKSRGKPMELCDLPDGYYVVESSNQVEDYQIITLREYFFRRGIFVAEVNRDSECAEVGYKFSKWLGRLRL